MDRKETQKKESLMLTQSTINVSGKNIVTDAAIRSDSISAVFKLQNKPDACLVKMAGSDSLMEIHEPFNKMARAIQPDTDCTTL